MPHRGISTLRSARKERIVKHLKAIIMAGGEGSRLRPLTCDCPKPMLRLLGKPLMERAIRLLQKYGIHEIGATLGYLPESIEDSFGDGERLGVQLRYYVEPAPLGTAGSVKQAQDFLNERFIVLSGDGATDFDLSAALRFHESHGGPATLILKKSGTPQEYGMVVTGADGRIRSFHEKPGRCDVFSDCINTGIYILEPEILRHIPADRPYDFGHDLFPALLEADIPLYGWTAEGYWCDVGDVAAYLQVHVDALDGKLRLDGPEDRQSGPCDGAILEPGCVIEAPCWIAPGAHVCSGAHIGAYSVVGENCFVASGAGVKRSVLFPGVRVEAGAQLRGCVVGCGAVIAEGAQLFEESCVGSHSIVGARSVLPPGVKLWPEKSLPEGERPEENIVWGSRREQRFVGGALQLESPAQAARSVCACVAEMKPRELLLGRGASTVAAALWHAVAAGAMAQGVQLIDAGVCSLPQLRHALKSLRADAAMLVEDARLIPLCSDGARIPEKTQRAILKLCERQDYAGPFSGITRAIQSTGRTDIAYIADAAAAFEADPLLAPEIALCAQNSHLLSLAERSFVRAGLRVRCEWNPEAFQVAPGELGILFSDSGEQASFITDRERMSEVERQLACAWTALEAGELRLILPVYASRAVDVLAERYGAGAACLAGEPAAWMHALADRAPRQFLLQLDGIQFALRFLSRLTEAGIAYDSWRKDMPAAFRSTRSMQVPSTQSGRLLHALAEEVPDAELGGGVRLMRNGGWAWLGPDERCAGLQIVTEAASMEAARELCDFYGGEIERLLSLRD